MWENPNTQAVFGITDIQIDTSEYSLIGFQFIMCNQYPYHVDYIAQSKGTHRVSSAYTSPDNQYTICDERYIVFNADHTKITIDENKHIISPGYPVVNNYYMIPIRIIGIV